MAVPTQLIMTVGLIRHLVAAAAAATLSVVIPRDHSCILSARSVFLAKILLTATASSCLRTADMVRPTDHAVARPRPRQEGQEGWEGGRGEKESGFTIQVQYAWKGSRTVGCRGIV